MFTPDIGAKLNTGMFSYRFIGHGVGYRVFADTNIDIFAYATSSEVAELIAAREILLPPPSFNPSEARRNLRLLDRISPNLITGSPSHCDPHRILQKHSRAVPAPSRRNIRP